MENPIKMDDLGVPLFLETPIFRGYVSFREGGYFFILLQSFYAADTCVKNPEHMLMVLHNV